MYVLKKKVSVLQKPLNVYFGKKKEYIYFFIEVSSIHWQSLGSCILLLCFFFNFDIYTSFISKILSIKIDFCYLEEHIHIAGVRKSVLALVG